MSKILDKLSKVVVLLSLHNKTLQSKEYFFNLLKLMALGFSQIDAAQAYFACDKNEEMAANLLFDRMANGDLDQQQGGGNQGANNQDDDDNLFQ